MNLIFILIGHISSMDTPRYAPPEGNTRACKRPSDGDRRRILQSYHKTTGIAGYTLIFNSHGIRIKSHQPFQSVYAALTENKDIESRSELVETERRTADGTQHRTPEKRFWKIIKGLKMLLQAYREGTME